MGYQCKTSGNLALKAKSSNAKLALVKPLRHNPQSGIYGSLAMQLFGFLQLDQASDVQDVLSGARKLHLLVSGKERRFAAIAAAIGCTALFYFSFFAF